MRVDPPLTLPQREGVVTIKASQLTNYQHFKNDSPVTPPR